MASRLSALFSRVQSAASKEAVTGQLNTASAQLNASTPFRYLKQQIYESPWIVGSFALATVGIAVPLIFYKDTPRDLPYFTWRACLEERPVIPIVGQEAPKPVQRYSN